MPTAGCEMIVRPVITVVCINPIPNACEGPYNQIEIVFVNDVVIQHLKMKRSEICRVVIWRPASASIARI